MRCIKSGILSNQIYNKNSFNYHKQAVKTQSMNIYNKNVKLSSKDDKVVIRYFDEVELLDKDVREMLNSRLAEAKNLYDKCNSVEKLKLCIGIQDHLDYQNTLIREM